MRVFILMNLSLWRIKVTQPDYDGFKIPLLVPVAGTLASGSFVLHQIIQVLK